MAIIVLAPTFQMGDLGSRTPSPPCFSGEDSGEEEGAPLVLKPPDWKRLSNKSNLRLCSGGACEAGS